MRLLSVSEELKRLSDLLKSGATMLSEACPDCHIPLYKKDDRIFCPKCNKSVAIVKSPEDEQQLTESLTLSNLEQTILNRLDEANRTLKISSDSKEIRRISDSIALWLNILEKLKQLR
jgi:UPF0148 protein